MANKGEREEDNNIKQQTVPSNDIHNAHVRLSLTSRQYLSRANI
ncbi:hypothetical protein [Kaarinaea lacus]